jgi:hypothetical protein
MTSQLKTKQFIGYRPRCLMHETRRYRRSLPKPEVRDYAYSRKAAMHDALLPTKIVCFHSLFLGKIIPYLLCSVHVHHVLVIRQYPKVSVFQLTSKRKQVKCQ